MYVGDTDAQALKEATPHIEAFYNRFLRSPNEYKAPPGYTSMSSMKQLIELKLKYRQGTPSIDTILKLGMAIVGSADTVAETLIEKQKSFGIGQLIGWLHFGTLPADLTRKNLELFAKKVMPRLRPLGEPAPAAKARAEAPAAE
jgi:alkanesulfonate monooxygenase SsuD/methylene tetrahydromethanopterin reductase-like flavin-dependent oxidoreductase (luciferase family)